MGAKKIPSLTATASQLYCAGATHELTMTTIHSRKNMPSKTKREKVVLIGRYAYTGAVARISDPAIKPSIEKLKKELSQDPEAARRFMEKLVT